MTSAGSHTPVMVFDDNNHHLTLPDSYANGSPTVLTVHLF